MEMSSTEVIHLLGRRAQQMNVWVSLQAFQNKHTYPARLMTLTAKLPSSAFEDFFLRFFPNTDNFNLIAKMYDIMSFSCIFLLD